MTRKAAPRTMLTELPTTAELFSRHSVLTAPFRLLFMSVSSPKREKPSVSNMRLMLVEILFNHLRVFAAVVACAFISGLSLIVARSIIPFCNTTNEPSHSGHDVRTFRSHSGEDCAHFAVASFFKIAFFRSRPFFVADHGWAVAFLFWFA